MKEISCTGSMWSMGTTGLAWAGLGWTASSCSKYHQANSGLGLIFASISQPENRCLF